MEFKKIKIHFIIYSLARGGAERVFSTIANGIDKTKFEIIFITINSDYENLFNLNDDIKALNLNKKKTIYAIKEIYQIIKKDAPDIVFSTIGQVNIIVGVISIILKRIYKKKTVFIMRETSIPSINNKKSQYPQWLLDFLIKRIYPYFDLLIAQGQNMKQDLISNFGIKSNLIKIVHNPILLNKVINHDSNTTKRNTNEIVFITVGNLTEIKGYDRLLEVIKNLKDKLSFKYYILGSGNQEIFIKNKIMEYQIQKYCFLTGSVNNVSDYLLKADLFIQGSYYEGFPNVLIEANQVGLPIVAFDVPGGTSEVINNGSNGFLVKDGDIDSFVDHILLALNTKFDKEEIINQTKAKFSNKKIISEYEELFSKIVNNYE